MIPNNENFKAPSVSPAVAGDAGELLADLDEYLKGCPPLTTEPKWLVKKPSRLLMRCRDLIRRLATPEQPGSAVQGEVAETCRNVGVSLDEVHGCGESNPMFGRMIGANFTEDTITLQMERGYYAASGRYAVRPAPKESE